MTLREAIRELHIVPRIPLREDADPYVIWLAATEQTKQAVIALLEPAVDPNFPDQALVDRVDLEFR